MITMHFTYCPNCGNKAIQKKIDNEGMISYCSQCEIPLRDIVSITGVICAVVNEYNEVVLLRQNNGLETQFVCPTGVLKTSETPEEAVRRIVQKGIGLDVEWLEFIESYVCQSQNIRMLGYKVYVKKIDLLLLYKANFAEWENLKSALKKMQEGSIEEKVIKQLQFDEIRMQMFNNIDKEIDLIRRHPNTYIGKKSISALGSFLDGYYFAHQYPGGGFVSLEVPPFFLFNIFVANNYHVSSSMPWYWNILRRTNQDDQKGMELFFQLYDSFRTIKIVDCQRIVIKSENMQFHSALSGIGKKFVMRYKYSDKDKEMEVPLYLHAQMLYCVSYSNKFGHLFIVEYPDACCFEYFTAKQSVRDHVKKFFGNVRWKRIDKSLLPQKPLYKRREILDVEGHCKYW